MVSKTGTFQKTDLDRENKPPIEVSQLTTYTRII